jgi:hypothetical protein
MLHATKRTTALPGFSGSASVPCLGPGVCLAASSASVRKPRCMGARPAGPASDWQARPAAPARARPGRTPAPGRAGCQPECVLRITVCGGEAAAREGPERGRRQRGARTLVHWYWTRRAAALSLPQCSLPGGRLRREAALTDSEPPWREASPDHGVWGGGCQRGSRILLHCSGGCPEPASVQPHGVWGLTALEGGCPEPTSVQPHGVRGFTVHCGGRLP